MEEAVLIFKAFSDQRRLEILQCLSKGERCACELLKEFNSSHSNLSYHMKILIDAKVVVSRPSGKWTVYTLCDQGINNAIHQIERITGRGY